MTEVPDMWLKVITTVHRTVLSFFFNSPCLCSPRNTGTPSCRPTSDNQPCRYRPTLWCLWRPKVRAERGDESHLPRGRGGGLIFDWIIAISAYMCRVLLIDESWLKLRGTTSGESVDVSTESTDTKKSYVNFKAAGGPCSYAARSCNDLRRSLESNLWRWSPAPIRIWTGVDDAKTLRPDKLTINHSLYPVSVFKIYKFYQLYLTEFVLKLT